MFPLRFPPSAFFLPQILFFLSVCPRLSLLYSHYAMLSKHDCISCFCLLFFSNFSSSVSLRPSLPFPLFFLCVSISLSLSIPLSLSIYLPIWFYLNHVHEEKKYFLMFSLPLIGSHTNARKPSNMSNIEENSTIFYALEIRSSDFLNRKELTVNIEVKGEAK